MNVRCPALTRRVRGRRPVRSRAVTTPRRTTIDVPRQRSSVSQRVPRTVAAPYRPRVRKRPLPSPHRRRTERFFLRLPAAEARFGSRGLAGPHPRNRPP
jgi:hypothetical protein